MAGGWVDYNCSPKKEGGQVCPFEQSEDFLKGIKLSVETSEGCCMAMTLRFFEMYIPGQSSDFLNWLKGEQGRKVVSENQTRYINNSKSLLGGFGTFMKAVVRLVEDSELEKLGYDKVEKMIFPTTDFSRLANDSVKQYPHPRIFKPAFFANASTGKSHAIGVILDSGASQYYFFDPNEGVAEFTDLDGMKKWVARASTACYNPAWSAYFMDAWKH